MKTIVIGVLGGKYNDNLNVIPLSHNIDRLNLRVITHHDPKVYVHGNEVKANYDILIDARPKHMEISEKDYLYKLTRNHNLVRLPKKEQHVHLIAMKQEIRDTKFIVPGKYEVDKSNGWLHGLPNDATKVMLKVSNGARGLGQVVLEANEGKTLHSLVDEYLRHLKSYKETEFESNSGKVHHLTGIEKSEGESLTILKENLSDVGFYEVIENITDEWRVWTDYECKPFLVGKRSLEKRVGGYNQATYIDEITDGEELPSGLLDLLKKLKLQQMSVDVFKTADGSWGVFEWQLQTGIASIGRDKVLAWHLKYIEDLILDMNIIAYPVE